MSRPIRIAYLGQYTLLLLFDAESWEAVEEFDGSAYALS
jgi:hypothetical protein